MTCRFIQVLQERGFIGNCTDLKGLDEFLSWPPDRQSYLSFYAGFDATAPSLHAGHLIQLMMLRKIQRFGYKPIVVLGGGTTQVGDPSFRCDERPLMGKEEIRRNAKSIKKVLSKYLIIHGEGTDALVLDNGEWLGKLNYLDFLRSIGRHFSMKRILSFDAVKSRLDSRCSMSFIEFNYPILQAYDFLHLHRKHYCYVQIGGSDQWGNIVNGIDLVRKVEGNSVFGITTPLLTASDGRKMGKTRGGSCVWLDGDLLSPFGYWQYWRNIPDHLVRQFLLWFTDLNTEECNRLGALKGKEINEAKVILANHATNILHPDYSIENTASKLFYQREKGIGLNLEIPVFHEDPMTITQFLVKSRLCSSGKEARNLIGMGSVRIDNLLVTDNGTRLASDCLVSAGRKKHSLFKRRGMDRTGGQNDPD